MASYLASLNWLRNQVLGKPDEMKSAGVGGEPYQRLAKNSLTP